MRLFPIGGFTFIFPIIVSTYAYADCRVELENLNKLTIQSIDAGIRAADALKKLGKAGNPVLCDNDNIAITYHRAKIDYYSHCETDREDAKSIINNAKRNITFYEDQLQELDCKSQ